MPDVSINARFLTQPITGVQRYSIELVRALDDLIENGEIKGYNFELLAPPCKTLHHLDLKNIPLRRVGISSGYLWEQFELPFYAKKGVLFCPGNVAPLISLLSKQKTIVTVHDLSYLYFPNAYSLLFKLAYRAILPNVFKNADAVITVSQAEKDSILKRYCYVRDRLYAIQNGTFATKNKREKEVSPKKSDTTPFVLYVGSLSKRKNLEGVLGVAKLLNDKGNIKFVIVGACERIFNNVKLDDSANYIEFKGQVDDMDELVQLYKEASCLVFPSFYESFGMPAIEAMYCGCPVITSHISSLPEICGDAALYCDPYNINDIAEKIMQVITDETLREDLRNKGFKQAEKYSWKSCARETFEVIETIMRS